MWQHFNWQEHIDNSKDVKICNYFFWSDHIYKIHCLQNLRRGNLLLHRRFLVMPYIPSILLALILAIFFVKVVLTFSFPWIIINIKVIWKSKRGQILIPWRGGLVSFQLFPLFQLKEMIPRKELSSTLQNSWLKNDNRTDTQGQHMRDYLEKNMVTTTNFIEMTENTPNQGDLLSTKRKCPRKCLLCLPQNTDTDWNCLRTIPTGSMCG